MSTESNDRQPRSNADPMRWIAIVLCAALCLAYATLSWCATAQKSATADEPFHVVVSWLMLHQGDYRAAPDVPPLWEFWIGLPLGSGGLRIDASSAAYRNLNTSFSGLLFLFRSLYQTSGIDAIALVRQSRMMSVWLSMLLGVLIARWAWVLGGPIAAVASSLLWAMDPNLLGHGSLAKNDIAFALVYAWLAYSLWRAGQRLGWPWIASLCLTVGLAVGTKLSGLLTGPLLAMMLLLRAVMPEPWPVLGHVLQKRWAKIGAALAVSIGAAITCYVIVWGAYRFRFDAGPRGMGLDLDSIVAALHNQQTFQRNGYRPISAAQWLQWKPDASTVALIWAARHQLMPQAWIGGALQTHLEAIGRRSFLCGDVYLDGRWYYFPLAFVFKEPLATLAIVLVAGVSGLLALWRRVFHGRGIASFARDWTMLAILIPAGVYGLLSLASPMNLGIRYLFPIYPMVFLASGLCAARLWRHGRRVRMALGVATLALVIESTAVFPNYIAFFNLASGGSRNGIHLLSDSNLDWGQDLPLLARWQQDHPAQPLYLAYFGTCDPAAYGIRYINVPGGFLYGPRPVWPRTGGIAAISATSLQGVSTDHSTEHGHATFADLFVGRKPFDILGGTIYLFRLEDPPTAKVTSQSPGE